MEVRYGTVGGPSEQEGVWTKTAVGGWNGGELRMMEVSAGQHQQASSVG